MKLDGVNLTDTQRVVLESGKALAKELGLTEFVMPTKEIVLSEADKAMAERLGLNESSYTVPSDDFEFTEGQTALIASPMGTKVGEIKVFVSEDARTRTTTYFLLGEPLFKKNQRFKDGEWVSVFAPDLNVPFHSTLYVS